MDTIWIRLTSVSTDKYKYYMFGSTGIVRFHSYKNITKLYDYRGHLVAIVEEKDFQIFELIKSFRNKLP